MPPGSPPPIVQYTLTTGWNLAGFTETLKMNASVYLSSLPHPSPMLPAPSYWEYIYAWDATNQRWTLIDTAANMGWLVPDQTFWILMYSGPYSLRPPV